MDKDTILELYDSNLDVIDLKLLAAPKYIINKKKVLEIQESFKKKLPSELYEEFQEACRAHLAVGEAEFEKSFVCGFELGLRLAVEALYNQ